MKSLISLETVENMLKENLTIINLDSNTIITPSACDFASSNGMKVVKDCGTGGCDYKDGIPEDVIYKYLKVMDEKNLLNDCFKEGIALTGECTNTPYKSKKDPAGLKFIKGDSVQMERLDTGNMDDKVYYQELIGSDDASSMNAGFMTIEKCNFGWDVECQEIYYIIEGVLTVKINGKVYTLSKGDSLFAPKGVSVEWGTPGKVKVFYATY